ncbi:MAG: phosphatase PAP2 family protein [Prevotellaceae bacterium]|jgi:undecaprenyl-diphosphatase|nr:phosphatase PAP2 family protein [Prevotellaceae bacterium]
MTFPAWDTDLFLFLNGLHSDFFDTLMWYASAKWTWVPLYVLILFLLYRRLGWRHFLLMLLGLALCVLLADRISSGFFKPLFERLRPTHALGDVVHTVRGYRGGRCGFVSSHAANMFAIAVYSLLLMRRRHFTVFMLVFALFVSYSRIYLGVHYPLDIICGGLLGAGIGWGVAALYRLGAKKLTQRYYMNEISVAEDFSAAELDGKPNITI